jgi:hypothetical protein
MLTSDTGEFPFILRKTNIVNGRSALTALLHLLSVEVKSGDHDTLKQVEDRHPAVTLYSCNVDAGVTECEIEDGIVKF